VFQSETNVAFASQSVYCIRKVGLNPQKVNPNGGAIAIGRTPPWRNYLTYNRPAGSDGRETHCDGPSAIGRDRRKIRSDEHVC
jgi:Thiolase, C-terminal domain